MCVYVTGAQDRGCPLLGLRSHPTLESQEARFLSRGWSIARALDMNDVYRFYIPAADVRRYVLSTRSQLSPRVLTFCDE
jgi:hypothetical protein